MDLSKLAEPFREDEYEWRIAQSGVSGGAPWAKVLCYLTARAAMDRLDQVCGPENWTVSYTHLAGGVMCRLSIRIDDEWITKEDGSDESAIEKFKGGISGALKRAANVWGCGRLLYKLPETWAECDANTKRFPNYAKTKDGKEFSWRPPELPEWALPAVAEASEDTPKKSPTGDSDPRSDAPAGKGGLPLPAKRKGTPLTGAQLKKIHALRRDIGVSEEAYKSILFTDFGETTSKDLSKASAAKLIDRLEQRRKQQIEQETKEVFGDADADSRMGKLRDSALGFASSIANMGQISIERREEALEEASLLVKLAELEKIIWASGDEKELEGFVIKLEAVVKELSF